jgi:hypothetical protein
MYLYCSPRGGFNDQLTVIDRAITYCSKYNRTLLLDTTKSCYQINWSDYFSFKDNQCPIICDIHKIREQLHDKLTVYPSCLNGKIIEILSKNCFQWSAENLNFVYRLNDSNIILRLPNQDQLEDVVVYSECMGGNGFALFKSLYFNDNIKIHCTSKYYTVPTPYLGIQIRNTDRVCDYVALYESNKELIHSYQIIYVATDCKEAVNFFKTSCVNSTVFNFTTFQENRGKSNLHYSTVSGDTKIKDMICDLYMITMCDHFLTSSIGGYVTLLKQCHKNDLVKRMFLDI